MNYDRIYEYRFAGVSRASKEVVWGEIARWFYRSMGAPHSVLDPACGDMEFIKAMPSPDKWGVDLREPAHMDSKVHFLKGNTLELDLPDARFDLIYISNFLEHLHSPEEISALLQKMYRCLKPQGRIAIMGPNFKYCSREYFDCADHRLVLTDVSIGEHLYAAGYSIERTIRKFLPFSFRGRLPASSLLTRLYLAMPFVWPFFGRQFLVIGKKSDSATPD